MKNKGQIITHSAITIGGIIVAVLSAYYAAQMGIQAEIATLSSAISGISATQTAQTTSISDLEKRVENIQQDFISLNTRFGITKN